MPHSSRQIRALVAFGLPLCLIGVGCFHESREVRMQGMLPTTRLRTIHPVAIPPGTPQVLPRDVAQYAVHGYSAWQPGPGEDLGRRFDLMPSGYAGSPNAARLLTYFAMSDVHVTDKESPAQAPYFAWIAPFNSTGARDLYSQAYSPVMLSTTQVLDAAIRTVNVLHRETPFHFGIFLGDVVNSSQFNELRWFIDVLDGRAITPSSGAHLGADTIGYQRPFQAAGLDSAIPWYEVIGNHDQYWMGVAFPSEKLSGAMVGGTVLNMGTSLFAPGAVDASGMYVGVIDGTTPYGDVIKGGPTASFPTPPTVAADANRHSVTTPASTTRTFIGEFFNSTSSPTGHGFNPANSGSTAACYTFEPLANLPLKVIVLDNTCKAFSPSGSLTYFGGGWIDAARQAWLTNELQKGQDAGQLMILAAHVPINPQKDLLDTTPAPQFYPESYQTDAQLIATLKTYPNLLMVMAGHRHINVVTPHPSTDPAHPENGFWEVEAPSLRDFPRQFRTFDLLRNSDNTISIVTTDVDPLVEPGSIAATSLGYAIGAARIFGNLALTDTTSHSFNVELVKKLSPAMQAKVAGWGLAMRP
jgi:metallophosphoesterase (TIGR03768 family)